VIRWLRRMFRFDGIQDDELPADSDWLWLTPLERLGIQTQADADIARQIIADRKANERWRIPRASDKS
jgi:hypothetical protein